VVVGDEAGLATAGITTNHRASQAGGGCHTGPRWVRTASGTAGPRRARVVMAGMHQSQVTAPAQPRPRPLDQR